MGDTVIFKDFISRVDDVDANKAVLDAAAYADANNLWEASSGNLADFANKAKVAVTNGYVGITGKGELTTYVNVYRTKTDIFTDVQEIHNVRSVEYGKYDRSIKKSKK